MFVVYPVLYYTPTVCFVTAISFVVTMPEIYIPASMYGGLYMSGGISPTSLLIIVVTGQTISIKMSWLFYGLFFFVPGH